MVVVIQHRSMPSLCLSWMRTEGLTFVGGTHTLGADKDVSDGGNCFVESEIARGGGQISERESCAVQSLSIESQAFGDDRVLSEDVRCVVEFQIFSTDAVWSDSGRSCWQSLGVAIDEPEIDSSQTSSPRIDSDWILPVIGDLCANDAASVSRFSNRPRSFSPRKNTLSVISSPYIFPDLSLENPSRTHGIYVALGCSVAVFFQGRDGRVFSSLFPCFRSLLSPPSRLVASCISFYRVDL
jgi:hypothetical protein